MKKRCSRAVQILMLLGGCLVLPTTTWASYFYGPSGALAQAVIADGGGTVAYCTSGFIPSAAACDTGSILGISTTGDAYLASAVGIAGLAGGVLDLNMGNVGADGIQAAAGVEIDDTLYFQGATFGQMGQLTMTATGSLSGNGSFANETLIVHFIYDYYSQFGYAGNGPWVNQTAAYTSRPGGLCYSLSGLPTEACYSSDGQNLSVSITFPLNSDGIYFQAAMSGQSYGEGFVNYTDPFTVTLPPGVTFTSASGEFLTQGPATGVPEPSSALLVGIAVAGIFGLRLTRKSA